MTNIAHLLGLGRAPNPGSRSGPLARGTLKRRAGSGEDEKRQREKEEHDEDLKRSRKGRADDDDDGEDERDGDDPAAAAARGRERARCAAIFASPHAAVRPDMAAHYAFATDLTRRQARRALAATTAGHLAAPASAIVRAGAAIRRSWDASAKRVGLVAAAEQAGQQPGAAAPGPPPAQQVPPASAAPAANAGASWAASAQRTGIPTK